MRILHTSDWHLGRSFHREGMLDHQAAFVDHLLDVVESESVDVVVLAGDVYDRALPPVDAVAVADDAFARLAESRARVVITSGNHDSAERLGFASRLIDAAGVHVRSRLSAVGQPVMISDARGEVAFYGIPYLDPGSTQVAWGLAERSHEAAMRAALTRVRADRAGRQPDLRTVVIAHAFVAGSAPSQSERDIAVGGVDRVPVDLFDGFDYVALGHLHRPQEVRERVRYSGSPLAYSFSESADLKGSLLIDLADPGSAPRTEFIPAPIPRPLGLLRGELEELLHDPAAAWAEDHWLQITLTDQLRPRDAMARLRVRFPHALVLAFEPSGPRPAGVAAKLPATLSDREVTGEFLRIVRGVPASPAELALVDAALDSCCSGDES